MWIVVLLSLLAVDGGSPDAGVADGGVVDAGAEPLPPERWSWRHDGGEWIGDGGLTDVLRVRVGETAHVKLPHPIVLMQCDAQLLTLDATEDTLLLTGAVAGKTTCGFWFDRRAWPHRTMDVTVLPR